MEESQKILSQMKDRITDLQSEKAKHLECIQEREEKLTQLGLLHHLPITKYPYDHRIEHMEQRLEEKIKDLEQQIQTLEFKRSTTSIKLTEEKQILKLMETYKTRIHEYQGQMEVYGKQKEWKEEREIHSTAIKTIEKKIKELQLGMKKLNVAKNLHCLPNELVTIEMKIPNEKLVATHEKGKNLRRINEIENSSVVCIEMEEEKTQVNLRITGSAVSTNNAKQKIEDLAFSEDHIIPLHPNHCMILSYRKCFYVVELKQNLGISKLDIQWDNGILIAHTTESKLKLLQEQLTNLIQGKEMMTIEPAMIRLLLNNKGKILSEIMESSGALIKLEREIREALILGPKESVCKAKEMLEELMKENEEKTEFFDLKFGDGFYNYLCENNGEKRKALKDKVLKLYGVEIGNPRIMIQKVVRKDATQQLKISCIRSLLPYFQQALATLEEEYKSNLLIIHVEERYYLSAIIGKDGETIKSIQDKTKTKIHIAERKKSAETEETEKTAYEIQIYGGEKETAKDLINDIIAKNYTETIEISIGVYQKLMENQRGLMKTMETNYDCAIHSFRELRFQQTDNEAVTTFKEAMLRYISEHKDRKLKLKIVGLQLTVENHIKPELAVLEKENQIEVVDIDRDMIPVVIGKNGEKVKEIREQFANLDIEINKEHSIIILRGTQQAIAQGKQAFITAIDEFYGGDNEGKHIVLHYDSHMMPLVIGKNGANIQKLNKEYKEKYEVVLDIYVDRGILRMKGQSKDQVAEAKQAFETYLNETFKSVDYTVLTEKEEEEEEVFYRRIATMELQLRYPKASINFRTKQGKVRVLRLRAPLACFMQCKERVVEIYSGIVKLEKEKQKIGYSETLVFPNAAYLAKVDHASFARLLQLYQCELEDSPKTASLTIHGKTIKGFMKVKDGIEKKLMKEFPSLQLENIQYSERLLRLLVEAQATMTEKLYFSFHLIADLRNRKMTVLRLFGNNESTFQTECVRRIEQLIEQCKQLHYERNLAEEEGEYSGFIGHFIGKQGQGIKKMEETYHIKVTVREKMIIIEGEQEENVQQGKAMLEEAIDAYQKENSYINLSQEEYQLLHDLGKGELEKQMEGYALYLFKREETEGGYLHLRLPKGNTNSIEKERFQQLVTTYFNENICQFLEVPNDYIPAFIGRKGENIMRLNDRYHVQIHVNKETNHVSISGRKDKVDLAITAIKEDLRSYHKPRPMETESRRKNTIEHSKSTESSPSEELEKPKPSKPIGESEPIKKSRMALRREKQKALRLAQRANEVMDMLQLGKEEPTTKKSTPSSKPLQEASLRPQNNQEEEEETTIYRSMNGYSIRL